MNRTFVILFCAINTFLFPQKLTEELQKYLIHYRINKNIPSISAGISVKGKIFWLGASGYSDIENSVPANTRTIYRVASISKSITAVAVMQLMEQGKLALDENVDKYIPYFPPKKWKFTIRQLLNHTSGIRDYRSGEFNSKDFYPSVREAINLLKKDSLQFKPGTKYLYTTLGYNLLAAVVEQISGMTFRSYLKKFIFEPLEMSSTDIEYQREIVHNRARGYTKNVYRMLENAPLADLSVKPAGGGMFSTAEDLLKFADGLLFGKLIKNPSLELMLKPTVINKDTFFYGFGFQIRKDDKARFYFGHPGTGTGFRAELVIYPEDSLAAVYLVNVRDRNTDNPSLILSSIFLDKNYQVPKKSLADALVNIVIRKDIDSAMNAAKILIADSGSVYDTSKSELLLFGYDLIEMNKIPEAIIFFKSLAAQYPNLSKAFVGLADAYYKDNNKGLAQRNYRTAVRLDPLDVYAANMIRKLQGYTRTR
ncbi:MAG: serine hydrolase [Ignavibacteria bacterium]